MANPRQSSGRLIHPQILGDGRSQYRCRLKNPTCVFGTAPPKPFGVGNVPKPEFSGRLKKWPIERMNDGRMTKRVMNSEAEGTRPRGRPKLE